MMRWITHVFARSAHTIFSETSLRRIADAVAQSELRHRGEICFAVESKLTLRALAAGSDARGRAYEVFSQLRVWDTAANNGVLIYLLLADRRIEILADRGLMELVSSEQWRGICQLMEERLRAGDAEGSAIAGISAASDLLVQYFPRIAGNGDENELPNRPHIQ